MKQIPLTQGKVALVDDDDFEVLSGYKWYCGNEGYAMRTAGTLKRGQRTIRMARFITDAPSDKQVDHTQGERPERATVAVWKDVTPEGYGPSETPVEDLSPQFRDSKLITEWDKLQNSLNEGKTILKGKMTPEKRLAVEKSVASTEAKIAELESRMPPKPISAEDIDRPYAPRRATVTERLTMAETDAKIRIRKRNRGGKAFDIGGATAEAVANTADLVIIGAAKMAKGAIEFKEWVVEMLREKPDLAEEHLDGDRLNNQKCNLRLCSNLENCRNQRKPRIVTSSVFKGVHRHSGNKCWQAAIRHGGKQIYLGVFTDEEQAARAYDEAAKKYHGEFALLNF